MTPHTRPDGPASDASSRLSKLLSLILRHKAHQFDLRVDDEGFVDLQGLLDVLHEQDGLEDVTEADIEHLNGSHIRRRFETRDGRIRATYGHSFSRPIRFDAIDPPEVLYVGMPKAQAQAARMTGIKPMGRQYVHLTDDLAEAEQVGSRGGEPAEVITVKAKAAAAAGIQFHLPTDGLFLSAKIPPEYLDVKVSFGRRSKRKKR